MAAGVPRLDLADHAVSPGKSPRRSRRCDRPSRHPRRWFVREGRVWPSTLASVSASVASALKAGMMTEIVMAEDSTVPPCSARTIPERAACPAFAGAARRHGKGTHIVTHFSRVVAGHHGVVMPTIIERRGIQDDEWHVVLDNPQEKVSVLSIDERLIEHADTVEHGTADKLPLPLDGRISSQGGMSGQAPGPPCRRRQSTSRAPLRRRPWARDRGARAAWRACPCGQISSASLKAMTSPVASEQTHVSCCRRSLVRIGEHCHA